MASKLLFLILFSRAFRSALLLFLSFHFSMRRVFFLDLGGFPGFICIQHLNSSLIIWIAINACLLFAQLRTPHSMTLS
ncbi:hypothetical protein BO82DRAFT_130401 [Aspergillus uvarum CBS 121591]|uniref:Uncharacterized protein n=1 Tax=Aspergillus uvarum CBS 121591 TaxID=1448315 RepID=A0A319CV61_9EURO|nr:hypothetical protein BO82DRAFT_130401 [Aspergillus uvarum CBS 121591]PYH79498.1 hypothetical protein BO82DRAFT_130401 [Aspergillus uvarum CBS 121591]